MDEGKKAISMWSMGFGDRNEVMFGEGVPIPERRALKSDWTTLPMPRANTEVKLDIPLTDEEFELLTLGHVPEVMEDHWFSYFDGEALNLHRSWSGVCIYRAYIERRVDGYAIVRATVNRDTSQYSETSDERDRVMVSILVGEALGKDVSALWEEYFSIEVDAAEHNTAGSVQPTIAGFWRAKDEIGFCSNWHPSGFDYCANRFETAEHWMMWQKACVMHDLETAESILVAPTPRAAKELGGKVKPYDNALWHDVREQLVYVGVREKFMQNPELAERLLATGTAVLAEASPYDHTWGVALSEDDERFQDISQWRGSNLLGRVCMRVRSDLRVASRCNIDLDGLSRCEDDMVFSLYRSEVGNMSPLELSRVPGARSAVLCWARIAQHHAADSFPTLDDFLSKAGRSTVEELDNSYRVNMGGGLTITGWHELLSQLAFMQAVGTL